MVVHPPRVARGVVASVLSPGQIAIDRWSWEYSLSGAASTRVISAFVPDLMQV